MHWRHEQLSLRIALVRASHHSFDRVHAEYAAPRSQKTGTRAGEGEVFESREAPRGQNTPHPGSGQRRCWRCGRRDYLSGTRRVGFELVLDPVVPQMAEQLVEVVATAPSVFPRQQCFKHQRLWWRTLHPFQLCFRPRLRWRTLHPRQQFFIQHRQWWSILLPRLLSKRQRLWWSILLLRLLSWRQRQWWRISHPRLLWTVGGSGCQPAGRGRCGPPSMRSARAWDSRRRRSASSSVSCPSRPQTLQTRSALCVATSWLLRRCSRRTRRRTTMMTMTRSMGLSLVFLLGSGHADVQVVLLRELPAGLGVYVRSLGERAAPPSSPVRRLLKMSLFSAPCSVDTRSCVSLPFPRK